MLREFSGAAKATSLVGDVSASATSITVADGTGYPTGAVGLFVVTIDAGLAAEEKVLCTSRTGNTLTVSSRGWDGTTATDHSNAATVQHTFSATDAREANAHVNDSTGDPHPQYLTAAEGVSQGDAAYVQRSQVQSASVATSQTTSSGSFTDLTSAGPAVTAQIGVSGAAMLVLTAGLSTSSAGDFAVMACAISGATTLSASDEIALAQQSGAAGQSVQASAVRVVTGLTPGSNTFTAKYRVSSGTGTFLRRHLIVIPL